MYDKDIASPIMSECLKINFVGEMLPSDIYYSQGFRVGGFFCEVVGRRWKKEIKNLNEKSDLAFGLQVISENNSGIRDNGNFIWNLAILNEFLKQ